jgi:DNA-binding winged helix-turn-helix (wHTH) protein/tetratricopeptide (TPR) repeat protein/TolB-like protein
MEHAVESGHVFCFGLFEADPARGILNRSGVRVKVQEQPFRLLLLLLERPGEVVSRDELRQKLWPEGTFVDFDGSLNVLLKRLRATIGDDPENPRFIETIPRRGYRFIAPVSVVATAKKYSQQLLASTAAATQVETVQVPPATVDQPVPVVHGRKGTGPYLIYAGSALVAVLLLGAAGSLVWPHVSEGSFGKNLGGMPIHVRKSVAVLGFRNLSGRSGDAWLATALSDMLSTELAGGEKLRLVSGEDVSNLRISSPWSQNDTLDQATSSRICKSLNSDVLVLGSYTMIGTGDGAQMRLDVRMQDGKTGEILTETAEVGSTQGLFRLVSRIGAELRGRLGVEQLQGSDEAGVLAAVPLDPDAARFYALGIAKLRQFDALAARDLLEQAAEADPRFPLVHAMLARAWGQLGYKQKHQEEAKKAFDLSADLPRALRLLVEGEYYDSVGKQEQAASVYHALFELFPDNADYGLRLAAAQTLSGHGGQAMEVIHRLRNLPSISDDPRIDLAEARAMKDDKQVALTLVRTAIRKASDRHEKLVYGTAKKEECMLLLYGEHPDQGPPSCEDAYNIFISAGNRLAAADTIRLLADGIGTQGHYEQAIATYERALDVLQGLGDNEKTGSVLNNMAIGFSNEGNLDRAEQLYREARVHFEQAGDRNNEVTAIGNVADILYLRGNLAAAEKLYRQALQIDASLDSSEPGYLLYRLADLNLTQGRVPEARRLAQQAVDDYLPTHGSYQYLSSAMVVLAEALKAGGDTAGARSQFEQTVTLREKIGALELVAESQAELAALAIEEDHAEQAEPLIRTALGEFQKEKSDPDSSSAYTLLSRALLMQGKVDEARTAAQRGAELSLTSSNPALRLPAEIQQARVEIATAGDKAGKMGTALQRLHAVIANAKRLGYYNIECEARLALGELELKLNSSLGQKHLKVLASETRSHGFELLARQAEHAASSGVVIAENRSVH